VNVDAAADPGPPLAFCIARACVRESSAIGSFFESDRLRVGLQDRGILIAENKLCLIAATAVTLMAKAGLAPIYSIRPLGYCISVIVEDSDIRGCTTSQRRMAW
jgi:hypothetical protein